VRAPIGGINVSKNAMRGQQVNPGRAATEQFRRQFEDRRRPYAGWLLMEMSGRLLKLKWWRSLP